MDTEREAWLRERQDSIGASEASAVVGLSGYQSAYGLWVQKTEPVRIEPMDELAEWGWLLEPIILEQFALRADIQVERCQPFVLLRDIQRPHLTCTLDGKTETGQPVQLKTAHFAAGKIWAKEVPLA